MAKEETTPKVPKIYSLIPKVMQEIGSVGKNKNAPSKVGGYAFRGIDDMYNAIQPALVKFGVFYVPRILEITRRDRNFSGGSAGIETTVKVEYTFFAEDGSSVVSVVTGEAMDSGDKSNNKALSCALKYCLMEIFCIPTEEAKDSENEHHELAKVQPPRAQPKQAQVKKPEPKAKPKDGPPECKTCGAEMLVAKSGKHWFCKNWQDGQEHNPIKIQQKPKVDEPPMREPGDEDFPDFENFEG